MQRTIFNDIVEGKVPCYKIYEDENYLSFLDLYPRAKGHSLVIPKKHYQWTYEVPDFGDYWNVARKVGLHLKTNLNAKWLSFFTHGSIPYAHIHILPRYEEITAEQAVIPEVNTMTKEELQAVHETIQRNKLI
jgi:histidine triad (HIT) family protein